MILGEKIEKHALESQGFPCGEVSYTNGQDVWIMNPSSHKNDRLAELESKLGFPQTQN